MQPGTKHVLGARPGFFHTLSPKSAELVSVNLISNREERFVLMFARVTNLPTSH